MWWMLLVLTVEGYSADSVYKNLDECLAARGEADVCVRVNISFAEGVPAE